MASEKNNEADPTIVGGRPLHRTVDASQLPKGLEQLFTLAALDPKFRDKVGEDPQAAAKSRGSN